MQEFDPDIWGGGGALAGDAGGFASEITPPTMPSLDIPAGGGFPESDRAAPAPDRSGEGFWGRTGRNFANEVSGDPLRAFTSALGLGGAGMSLFNASRAMGQLSQQQAFQRRAQQQAQAAAAPAVAAGTADINRAQAGQLQPSQEAAIQQWVQQAKSAMASKYAAMGQGNSSSLQSEYDRIDQAALAMRQEMLSKEELIGGQLISTGVQAAGTSGQMSADQSRLLTDLMTAASQQLGLLGGRSG